MSGPAFQLEGYTIRRGVGWDSHALLLKFILGLQQNTAFGSTA